MTPKAIFRQETGAVDYTPAAAKVAGDVVQLDDGRAGIVSTDLAASEKGALETEGIHDFLAASATLFSVGDDVFWDYSANLAIRAEDAIGEDFRVGPALVAKVDGETRVRVDLNGQLLPALLYNNKAASAALTNTVTETAFDKSVIIGASKLKVGDELNIEALVKATATNSTDTLKAKLYVGSQAIVDSGAVDVADNDIIQLSAKIVVRAIGASGKIIAMCSIAIGAPGTAARKAQDLVETTIDLTAAQTIAVKGTWSVAHAGNSCRLEILSVKLDRK